MGPSFALRSRCRPPEALRTRTLSRGATTCSLPRQALRVGTRGRRNIEAVLRGITGKAAAESQDNSEEAEHTSEPAQDAAHDCGDLLGLLESLAWPARGAWRQDSGPSPR